MVAPPRKAPRPIGELWAQPAPTAVVILGKGPSLERWSDAMAQDAPVLGINETCAVYRTTWFIYCDEHVQRQAPLAGSLPIRSANHASHHGGRGYIYTDADLSPERKIYKVAGGTISIALLLLGKWGVRNIWMVGFDGYEGRTVGVASPQVYARTLDRHITKRRKHDDYAGINRGINAALRLFEFRTWWFHRGQMMLVPEGDTPTAPIVEHGGPPRKERNTLGVL